MFQTSYDTVKFKPASRSQHTVVSVLLKNQWLETKAKTKARFFFAPDFLGGVFEVMTVLEDPIPDEQSSSSSTLSRQALRPIKK